MYYDARPSEVQNEPAFEEEEGALSPRGRLKVEGSISLIKSKFQLQNGDSLNRETILNSVSMT